MAAPKYKLESLKHTTILSAYLVVVWGLYRLIFRFPDEIEEFVIKPLLWLIPVFYFVSKERQGLSSLGVTLKKLFPAIYSALALGGLFVLEAVIVNYIKHKGFDFSANIGSGAFLSSFWLSFPTAVTEELTFRGYIFTRLWKDFNSEWLANIITTCVWTLIHIPITFFVWKLDATAAITYLVLTSIFAVGSAFIFARTKNIFSSILLHILWEWPIILFR